MAMYSSGNISGTQIQLELKFKNQRIMKNHENQQTNSYSWPEKEIKKETLSSEKNVPPYFLQKP